jgi:hypothetical protein
MAADPESLNWVLLLHMVNTWSGKTKKSRKRGYIKKTRLSVCPEEELKEPCGCLFK